MGTERSPEHMFCVLRNKQTPCDQGVCLERATRFELATLTLAR